MRAWSSGRGRPRPRWSRPSCCGSGRGGGPPPSWPRLARWPDRPAAAGRLAGDLLVAGAVGCEALFIHMNKRLRAPLPPLAQSAAITGLGLVLSAVPALLLEPGWASAAVSGTAFAAVGNHAVVPTVRDFLLWYAELARTTGTKAALFTEFEPVSAVTLAVLLPGEPLHAAHVGGLALVLASVLSGKTGGGRSRQQRRGLLFVSAAGGPSTGLYSLLFVGASAFERRPPGPSRRLDRFDGKGRADKPRRRGTLGRALGYCGGGPDPFRWRRHRTNLFPALSPRDTRTRRART